MFELGSGLLMSSVRSFVDVLVNLFASESFFASWCQAYFLSFRHGHA
jgi:hypothetical protein